jgi:hypothetical protein
MIPPFENLQIFYGDMHNHCNVGYGHGSIADAFQNAMLQLDFVCVTPHAYWHDLPEEPRLVAVANYHRKGFQRTACQWEHVQDMVREHHRTGKFVTLLGFEWHSCRYGDHNVYFKGDTGHIIRANDMPEMREALRQVSASGTETMLIPHHIGYKAGYRGINWDEVDPEFIHLVEIMSMHGASESPTLPHRYLHTMGPLDWRSSLQYGLERGHVVGVVGSTDHHSAHPGSYGHGRVGVWADALTRDGIWDALIARRTMALTGDRIALQFALNDYPMGSVVPANDHRMIDIAVVGGDTLDYVELLHNNQRIKRWSPEPASDDRWPDTVKVAVEFGWGERGIDVDWHIELTVVDGQLLDIEPRFRGHEIVEPQASEHANYAFSSWQRNDDAGITATTRTWGNPTTTTANTQGMCFEINSDSHTRLVGTVNGKPVDVRVNDLLHGPQADYIAGFLTPAYYFHRAVRQSEYTARFQFEHTVPGNQRDWYHARVRQTNGHWAWSSPIWVNPFHD